MARFLTTPVLCLAAAAALWCAVPAIAQTADTAPSVTVKYGDLNVGSRAGVQALLRRIEFAASTACGGAPDIRELGRLAGFEACRRSAVGRAVTAVNSPMLTAMARGDKPGGFAAR